MAVRTHTDRLASSMKIKRSLSFCSLYKRHSVLFRNPNQRAEYKEIIPLNTVRHFPPFCKRKNVCVFQGLAVSGRMPQNECLYSIAILIVGMAVVLS